MHNVFDQKGEREERRKESMVVPTEKHGNGHGGREGRNNSKTSGPRTRRNGDAHASESIFLGEGKVSTNMSGGNAVPKRT